MRSIGLALTDTLDDLISDERINPQLAMKILGNFDQAITEALQKNVKAKLSFKVGNVLEDLPDAPLSRWGTLAHMQNRLLTILPACRAASTRIVSATKCGRFLSRT